MLAITSLVLLAGAGCRDNAPNDDSFVRGGSRLKPRYLDGGDGARAFIGFYDTQEGGPCTWAYDTEGTPRCLPAARGHLRFMDAECTQPILLHTACGGVPDEITARLARGCDGGLERVGVYRVDGLIQPPTAYEIAEGSGECFEFGIEANATYYGLTELSTTRFVGGTESNIGLGYGLEGVVLNGDDASRWMEGLFDVERQVACAPDAFEDVDAATELRCVPVSAATENGTYFADTGCAVPLAYATASFGQAECPIEPGIARVYSAASCGSVVTTHALGDEWTEIAYWTLDGACDPENSALEIRLYEIGPTATASDFPPLMRVNSGTGRLRASQLATPNENVVAVSPDPYQWIDGQFDQACAPLLDETGQTRCAPIDTYPEISIFYANSECTEPAYWFSGGCEFQPPAAVSMLRDVCGELVLSDAYRLGSMIEGTVAWAIDGGTDECVEVDMGEGFFYRQGPQIPLTSLAVMTVVLNE